MGEKLIATKANSIFFFSWLDQLPHTWLYFYKLLPRTVLQAAKMLLTKCVENQAVINQNIETVVTFLYNPIEIEAAQNSIQSYYAKNIIYSSIAA